MKAADTQRARSRRASSMDTESIIDCDDAAAFSAVRGGSTQAVWDDPEALATAAGESWSSQRFLDEFSLVMLDTPVSSRLSLDRDQVRAPKAHRHDGFGMAVIECGPRGGEIEAIEMKGGGGVNWRRADEPHAYGGLSLSESVAELVNSIVLGRILPHGTVP